jgi:hypothetical protein
MVNVGVVLMPDYKKMYFQLAAKVGNVVDILVEAQRQGETDYVEGEPVIISLVDAESKTKDREQN